MLELRKKGNKHWLLIDEEIGEFTPSKFTINRLNNVINIVYFNNLKSKEYNVSDCYIFDIDDTSGFNTSNGVAFMDKLEELNCPCFQKDVNNFYISGGTWGSITGDIEEQADLISKFDEKQDILNAINLGEIIYNELAIKDTPSPDDEIVMYDSLTGESVTAKFSSFGGSTIESELQKYWFSYIASHVTSAVLYTNVAASGNLTTTGTQSLISAVGTNLYNSFHFLNWVGATTSGANAGIKNNNSADAYYRQGVKAYFIFGNNDANTAHSTVVGMYGLATAIPNVAISSFTTDFVGVGNDASDTNLSLYCKRNDATASYIKIDCGSNFPAHTAGTDVFMLEFESNKTSVQADLVITLTLTNLITGDIFTHTFTGLECPDLNKGMFTTINRNNRSSGSTPIIRWVKTFVERKLF